MEVVSPAGIEIGKCLWVPLQQHMGYLIHFTSNVTNLRNRVAVLVSRRNDIRGILEERRHRSGEVAKEEVNRWLERADDIEKECNTLDQEVEDKRCLMGWCPNWSWRYRLSKQSKKKLDIVVELLSEGDFGESVTIRASFPRVVPQPTPWDVNLATVKSSMAQVMNAINDEKVRIIGVYGMGGVGKTTLVKNVNNQLENKPLFDKVVMVTVTKEVWLERLQSDIADGFGFELKERSIFTRANALRQKLIKEGKFLIILDDLWEGLELESIGIPYGADDRKGCKILLTSRNKDVCTSMKSDRVINVAVLSEEESWELFKQEVGDLADDTALNSLARDVAKECAGLPLAIKTLGRALRKKDLPRWKYALSELQNSAFIDIPDMEKNVYQSIKLSYDCLRNEELKKCFLFCCVFPKGYNIVEDHLVKYWMAEGFLKNADWEDVLNQGHSYIGELKDSCLLLGSQNIGCTRMHDIVRDVAIIIASKVEKIFLVKAGLGLDHWPEEDELEKYNMISLISLMNNRIEDLPERIECLQLQTLMMQGNLKLRKIPDRFFGGIETTLLVLDLSNTSIRQLPPSMLKLVNLRKLDLQECQELETDGLSPLKGLMKLESLNLSRTNIEILPIEIGKLTNLRSLDLSFTQSLVRVPPNIISKLIRLKELNMLGSFCEWEIEGGHENKSNATLAEVASLLQLTCLCLDIRDVYRFLQEDLFKYSTHLKRFRFLLNDTIRDVHYGALLDVISNYPQLMFIEGSNPIPRWVKKFFPQTIYLYLYKLEGVRTILELADKESGSFQSLQHLQIRNSSIEYLLSGEESQLKSLQHLVLHNIGKLKKVISSNAPLPPGTFQNLRYFILNSCSSLTHLLFPPNLLQRMDSLTDIEVSNCEELEHVFISREVNDAVLPKLERLTINILPKMKSIWTGLVPHGSLRNLQYLKITVCDSLKSALPLSALAEEWLPNLVELLVRDCRNVEVLISEEEEDADIKRTLPNLTNLFLIDLPKMEHIVSRGALVLPSLQEIHVAQCWNMKRLPLANTPSLKLIKGEKKWWEGLEWENDSIKARFQPMFLARS